MSGCHYHIYVYLQGDTRMLLCTVESVSSVASVVAMLIGADHPEFTRVEVEIFRPIHHE